MRRAGVGPAPPAAQKTSLASSRRAGSAPPRRCGGPRPPALADDSEDEEGGPPDFGDAVELRPGDVPVFWACGVTPQSALAGAALPLCVTHAPGHMFVCDLRDDDLRV